MNRSPRESLYLKVQRLSAIFTSTLRKVWEVATEYVGIASSPTTDESVTNWTEGSDSEFPDSFITASTSIPMDLRGMIRILPEGNWTEEARRLAILVLTAPCRIRRKGKLSKAAPPLHRLDLRRLKENRCREEPFSFPHFRSLEWIHTI